MRCAIHIQVNLVSGTVYDKRGGGCRCPYLLSRKDNLGARGGTEATGITAPALNLYMKEWPVLSSHSKEASTGGMPVSVVSYSQSECFIGGNTARDLAQVEVACSRSHLAAKTCWTGVGVTELDTSFQV